MRHTLPYYLVALACGLGGYFGLDAWGPDILLILKQSDYVVESPAFLWALLTIPLLIMIQAHTLSDLPRVQRLLSLVLRSAIVILITGSLIDVQKIDREPITTSTIYVVDVSESIPDAMLERTHRVLEKTWKERGMNEVRLVVFAGSAKEVPLPMTGETLYPIPRLSSAQGDSKATNIQDALRFTFSLFPEDRLKRIVLVTDGLETQGDLVAEASVATRFSIPVHYLDLTDTPRPGELMVNQVEVPDSVRPNIPFKVKAKMKTTRAMSASCELKIGTLVEKIKEVELAQGESTVTFEAKVKEGGEKRVSVSCKTTREEDDRFKSNNRFAISLKIPDRPKVLYVEGERRYRKNLLAALDRDFKVELRGPRGVPSSLSDAKKFDLIFVSDVPRAGRMGYANMSTKQMKVLERYARAGGGIIFSGGENSFGPGGYGGTYLERKVLPVLLNVQKKEDIPGLALMLVIDRSGSMSGSKLELAKEAARATLDVLQPSDKLGVITFDSRPTTVVRLQRAANRMRIGQSLARITPGGGTEIFPALDKAYQELTSTNAKVKHIILLTDGQSNRSGILELVSQSYQDRITISTVAVGRGSDTSLLIQVAEEGGGRYYFTDRAANIPKLFLKETSEVSRRALVEDRFRPRIPRAFRRLQIFRGLNTKRFPSLLGYVATRPKRRAEVLMISHLKEPILARWRLGLGKVVVWTSDVKNRWSHYWLKWPGYAQFWRQLIRDSRRVEKETPTFNMVADISQGILSVGVDAVDRNDRFIDGLESKVNVIGPKGTSSSLTLKQTAAGRYEGKLPLKEYGPYTIKGKHNPTANPTKTFESYSMVAWPFPSEHLVGEPNLTQVEDMAQMTSGRKAPTNARLFDNEGKEKEKHTPLWAYPLYLILGLLILDLLLRRVRFYGSTTIRWKDIRQET